MSAEHSRIIRNRTKGIQRGQAADGAMVGRATERLVSASRSGREIAAGIGTAAREWAPQLTGENTGIFKAVALEWIGSKKGNWSSLYLKRVERGLAADVFPFVGHLPLHSITANDIQQVLDHVIDRGAVAVGLHDGHAGGVQAGFSSRDYAEAGFAEGRAEAPLGAGETCLQRGILRRVSEVG